MADKQFRIRTATMDDLEVLFSLEVRCFETGPYRHHRFERSQYRYYLANPQAIVLLALAGDRPIGSLLATAGRRSRAHVGRIVSIAVVRHRRRQGIGSGLLAQALRALRQRGCRRVYLEVAHTAKAALSMFRATGFRPVRSLPSYYGRFTDGLRMMLDFEKS